MKQILKMPWCCLAGLAVALVTCQVCAFQQPAAAEPVAPALISEKDIESLDAELAHQGDGKSATEMRMAYKGVVRQGKALLEAHPDAPNRHRVLGIVFQSQKRLLGLDNSDRNRSDLLDTCQELARAPNEYASLRLEAELLLSDRDLSAKDATLEDRAKALSALIERYRDTPAEAKSLMMAAMIAPKLQARDLENNILDALTERFSDDPTVIEFIQKNLGVRRLDVLFAGTFTRLDGAVLRFSTDRLGHLCLMVFWSKESPGYERYLKQVKEQQVLYSNVFDVFSLNVDELPDAGQSILSSLELNWTVLRLPGGRKSQAFRTYAQKDPQFVLVNGYGHAVLTPAVVRNDAFKIDEARVSDDRYLAQLQSLFSGDFLVTEAEPTWDPSLPPELKMTSASANPPSSSRLNRTAESVPTETLSAIQACFTPPPFRYRLTPAEALANYTKAENLCRAAAEKYAAAPDLWIVRNRWIIALLGMWNSTAEPKHFELAVQQARAALTAKSPSGADVVPRFCLAIDAIRRSDSEPKAILSTLIEETGGSQAPPSAVAAAAILAIEANASDLHNIYRSKILEAPDDGSPPLWSVVSFLRDRYHRYNLLKGSFTRAEDRAARSYIVNHNLVPTTNPLPAIELKTLDGKTLSVPKDTNGKLTLLVFVEPPDVIKPKVELDAKGQKKKKDPNLVMDRAINLAERHIHRELNVIAAFLCDDPVKVQAMMEAEEWKCRAAIVPGGLANPLVQRLGIYSADRIPNVFLLRRDGTIQWQGPGFKYKAELSTEFSMYLAMKVHTEVCEVETAYEALRKGDFKQAASVFSGPFLPEKDERYQWAAPRFHGRALANMGLKEWDAALADIDVAIEDHQKGFGDAKTGNCDIVADLRRVRATILDQLGRKEEAAAERKLATAPATAHSASPYSVFHKKLDALKLGQH